MVSLRFAGKSCAVDHDTALGLYLRRVWMWVVQLRVVALELHTVIVHRE